MGSLSRHSINIQYFLHTLANNATASAQTDHAWYRRIPPFPLRVVLLSAFTPAKRLTNIQRIRPLHNHLPILTNRTNLRLLTPLTHQLLRPLRQIRIVTERRIATMQLLDRRWQRRRRSGGGLGRGGGAGAQRFAEAVAVDDGAVGFADSADANGGCFKGAGRAGWGGTPEVDGGAGRRGSRRGG